MTMSASFTTPTAAQPIPPLDDQPPTTALRLLKKVNDDYALVILGDRTAVLQERITDDGRRETRFLSITSFHDWLRPITYLERGPEKDVRRYVSRVWMQWPKRRQFDAVIFEPNAPPDPARYNLWRGFATQPSPDGSCQRFIDHVADNVCSGDESLFNWVMGWFAQLVQDPTNKLGTSLVLRGPQGAGKSMVGTIIGSLLEPHYWLVSESRYLVGRFNAHLATLLLLQLDEATWGGDHAAAGKLRDLITGDTQQIEYKGKEPIRVRNYLRLLVTGNNSWLVPAGIDERRFAVVDVGDRCAQNHTYFARIRQELDAGGRAALLYYLLNFDYSDVPLREIPSTMALAEQKVASLDVEQQWWLDMLRRGQLPGDRDGIGETDCSALYEHYIDQAQRRGVARRGSETALGIALRRMVPGLARKRRSQLQPGGGSLRHWVYSFPALSECRAAFARVATNLTSELDEAWDGESPANWQPSATAHANTS